MKKLLVLLLSALLILGLAACGVTGEDSNGAEAGAAVADFLDEFGDELRDSIAPLGVMLGEGGRIDLLAGDEEELIFVFVHGSDVETAGMDDMLEDVLTHTAPVFEEFAELLRDELDLSSARVTVRFTDAEGGLLLERSFSS